MRVCLICRQQMQIQLRTFAGGTKNEKAIETYECPTCGHIDDQPRDPFHYIKPVYTTRRKKC